MIETVATACLKRTDAKDALVLIIVAIILALLGPGLFPRIA